MQWSLTWHAAQSLTSWVGCSEGESADHSYDSRAGDHASCVVDALGGAGGIALSLGIGAKIFRAGGAKSLSDSNSSGGASSSGISSGGGTSSDGGTSSGGTSSGGAVGIALGLGHAA